MSKGGFLRKSKQGKSDQAIRARRDARPQRPTQQPTFSYYANRMPSETTRLRSEQTIAAKELGQKKADSPSFFSQALSWLGLVLFIAVMARALSLSNESRVIVSEKTSAQTVSQESLERYAAYADKLLGDSVLNRSKVTINTTGIEKAMQAEFPELESVVVTVPLVSMRPIVYVLPTPALISIETTKGTFSLGSNGRVIAKIPEGGNKGLVVRDLSGVPPEIGGSLLPSSTMKFIQTLEYQFSKAALPIESLTLPNSASFELDAKLAGRAGAIKFNLEENAQQQSGAAIGTLRKLGGTPWQYIDVRVPERAYYK